MTKKKRKKKISLFFSVEGAVRERAFLDYLMEIYQPRVHGIREQIDSTSGGSSERILGVALREAYNRERVIAWFDEDGGLDDENKENLIRNYWRYPDNIPSDLPRLQFECNPDNRNPVLVVSNPVCVEGLILRILGRTIPDLSCNLEEKKRKLKDSMSGIFGCRSNYDTEINHYRSHLSKAALEEKRREILELNLLITALENERIS